MFEYDSHMSAFAYPAAYTIGSLGAHVLEAPAILWNPCFASKSWKMFSERAKVALRVGGHNPPWKRPNLAAPNTTYNLNNPDAWGRFTICSRGLLKLRQCGVQRSGYPSTRSFNACGDQKENCI